MDCVLLGDSTAVGAGAQMPIGPSIASRLSTPLEVVGIGHVGATTPDAMGHVAALTWADPRLVIISLGSNDVRRVPLPAGALQSETEVLIDAVARVAPGATVAHLGPAPLDTSPRVPAWLRRVLRRRVDRVDAEVARACASRDIPHVGLARRTRPTFAGRLDLFAADGMHLNDDGYDRCAALLAPALEDVLDTAA